MKSLALCPYVPFPPDHGGRIRSGVLVAALRACGEVIVVAPVLDAERAGAEALGVEHGVELRVVPGAGAATGVSAKLAHWSSGRSEMLWRHWPSAARRAAARVLSSERPDLVAVDSSFAWPGLPRGCDAPVLLQLHNVESALVRRSTARASTARDRVLRRVESRLLERAETAAVRRAACTVTVSDVDAELARSLVSDARVEVVPNTVDVGALAQLPPVDGGAAPELLFVGSFGYPPNVEAARELVERHLPVLRARWPELHLRLVGRDPAASLAGLRGLPGVEVVGFARDLRAEYERASAVYLPLRTGGGTRLKVLEAFAFGRPVLSTELGVEGLGVVAGREYLTCETPSEGVASLTRVMNGTAADVIAAARARVEACFDHAAAVERLAAICAELGSPDLPARIS